MSDERARLYARLPVTPAVSWWVDLVRGVPGGRVLELGAGTGRITQFLTDVALVVAVDIDEPSLDLLRDHQPDVRAVLADVRELDLGERFGAVLLPVALLNEVGDLASRRATMAVAAAHLDENGVLALEVLNPHWMTAGGESEGLVEGVDGDVWMTAAHDPGDVWSQHVRADLTYRWDDGDELRDRLDAHAVFPVEIELLLAEVGLEITGAFGSDPASGAPPTDEDGSWYVTARRAEPQPSER